MPSPQSGVLAFSLSHRSLVERGIIVQKARVEVYWLMGFALTAEGCGRGSVGATSDAAADGIATTIKLDAPPGADAAPPDASVVGDSGSGVPACHGENGVCGTSVDYCCEGYACGTTNLEPTPHCMKMCVGHSECSTGCCAPLGDSSITVCLPQLFCPDIFCSTEDQACVGDVPCCDGLACAVFDTTPPTSVCKRVCTRHEECATGCCAPLGTSGINVCLAQSFCPALFCRTEDQSCLDENPCCDGLVCAVFSTTPVTSACRPICERHEDCATTCCASLGKDYPSACLDKTYCGR